jgi:outer membrane protein assembly factor BamB
METDWNPEALDSGPRVLWRKDIGTGYSNVAITDGFLYTMGRVKKENIIYCLKADTGEEIWQYAFDEILFPNSTPVIDGKSVYALSYNGLLLCLNVKNGKLQWKKDLVKEYNTEKIRYGYAGSPVIVDDLVILNVNTAGIALSKKTGELIWDSNIHTDEIPPNGYHATPVLCENKGKQCALLFSGTGLYSVEVETGKQLWHFEWITEGSQAADPILFEKKVFISVGAGYPSDRGILLEIARNKPKEVWKTENMENEFSSCVYVDGYLYGSDGKCGKVVPLRCIDVQTGDVMWEQEMKMASLIAADGKLIILEQNGTLHVIEATPSAYKEISSCDVYAGEPRGRKFWSPPVLCNGKVYCRNYSKDLICIDVGE